MSQMVIEVYRAFEAANEPDDEAEAAARAVAERNERVVTREVLREELEGFVTKGHLDLELAKLGAELRSEIRSFRLELLSEIGSVRSDMNSEIRSVRSKMRSEIASVRSEIASLRAEIQSQLKNEIKALEDRLGRRIYALFAALAVLISVYEFIG